MSVGEVVGLSITCRKVGPEASGDPKIIIRVPHDLFKFTNADEKGSDSSFEGGSCEELKDGSSRKMGVRGSARSTQVEGALRARFQPWLKIRVGSGLARFDFFTGSAQWPLSLRRMSLWRFARRNLQGHPLVRGSHGERFM